MEHINSRLEKRIRASLYAMVFLISLLGLSIMLESCSDKCEATQEFIYLEPVYTTLEDLRAAVSIEEPRSIDAAGRIYIKDHWLFVNEPGKGIHLFNNSDARNPVPVNFINIPGNYDISVKGNTLYADSFIDLVVFDISTPTDIKELKRLENVFSNYNTLGFYLDASKGLITEWVEKKEVKVYESDCDANVQAWGGFYYKGGIAVEAASFDRSAALAPGNGSGPGVGGSMARFAINADHLYALDGADIQVIDVTNAVNPVAGNRQTISFDIETIFPYKNNLFIGSRSGMHIFDVTNPASPSFLSTYSHVRVCDPVVVNDTIAYVTLRSGSECEGFTNQLEVIDISDLTNPQIIETYPMTNPHGLGIDLNTLFICDGSDGLKIFDASNHHAIDQNLLAHYPGITTFDVIPFNNRLIMLAQEGIYQYDYSDLDNISLLSHIPISSAAD